MPKSIKQYHDKEKAREYRNRQRKRNYDKTKNVARKGKKWTEEEIYYLLVWTDSDRSLSDYIQRSVRAIQIKRTRIGGELTK